MKTRIGLLSLTVILLGSPGEAQMNVTVSGVVSAKDSGRNIGGARITVVGGRANDTVTDSDGAFVLTFAEDVKVGSAVRIHVEKQGFKPYEKLISVSPTIPLHISLEPIKSNKSFRST